MFDFIGIFDPEHRHDLVMCDGDRIDYRVSNLISAAFGSHFPTLSAIMLIQRECIFESQWASEWTDLFFRFLQPLTQTHLLTNNEVNGKAYGFSPQYTANFPSQLAITSFPNELTLKVYKGNSVRVSYLERSHSVSSAPYCRNITNYIDCWNRRVKIYSAPDDSDREFKIDSSSWLLNSVVVEGDGLFIGITDEEKRLVLYDFLSQTLQNITNKLRLSQCYVLTGVTAKVSTRFAIYQGVRSYPTFWWQGNGYNCNIYIAELVGETIEFSSPVFQIAPDSYHYAVYVRADGIGTNKLGAFFDAINERLMVKIKSRFTFFDQWRQSNKVKNLPGFDIDAPGDNSHVLEINIPNALGEFGSVLHYTEKNTYPPDSDWLPQINDEMPYGVTWASDLQYQYYPDGRAVLCWADSYVYQMIKHPSGPNAFSGAVRLSSYTQQINNDYQSFWVKQWRNDWAAHKLVRLRHSSYPGLDKPQITTNNVYLSLNTNAIKECYRFAFNTSPVTNNYNPRPSYDQMVFGEKYHSYLPGIDSQEHGYFQKRCPYTGYGIGQYQRFVDYNYDDGIPWGQGTFWEQSHKADAEERRIFYTRLDAMTVPFLGDEDYNLFSGGQVAIIRNSIDVRESHSYEGWRGGGFGRDSYYLRTWIVTRDEITSKQTFLINVNSDNVEDTVISHSLLANENTVTFTNTGVGDRSTERGQTSSQWNRWNYETVTQEVALNRPLRIQSLDPMNLRVTFENEKQITTVISDSQAVTRIASFNFDPDEDNRDIMPVPKMLEEIHAALQADKYSTDPSTGSPRTWNLGMMIHALTMANGLNISPDGKPRNPEDYVVYQDGDAVSDRYGQGQAGIEYKQLDGELTPCPGYLYDVQTPNLQKNPFTGEISDLGTGGMLGCSNVLQAKAAFERDFGKAFGIDQSVGVIPSADGGYTTYEGLMDVATEQLYMQSYHSLIQMKSFINSQKGVLMLQEVFQAIGVAVEPKEFELFIQGQSVTGVYPGSADSGSVLDTLCLCLLQLAHMIPQTMAMPSPRLEAAPASPNSINPAE